jgi:hypothetical protein
MTNNHHVVSTSCRPTASRRYALAPIVSLCLVLFIWCPNLAAVEFSYLPDAVESEIFAEAVMNVPGDFHNDSTTVDAYVSAALLVAASQSNSCINSSPCDSATASGATHTTTSLSARAGKCHIVADLSVNARVEGSGTLSGCCRPDTTPPDCFASCGVGGRGVGGGSLIVSFSLTDPASILISGSLTLNTSIPSPYSSWYAQGSLEVSVWEKTHDGSFGLVDIWLGFLTPEDPGNLSIRRADGAPVVVDLWEGDFFILLTGSLVYADGIIESPRFPGTQQFGYTAATWGKVRASVCGPSHLSPFPHQEQESLE